MKPCQHPQGGGSYCLHQLVWGTKHSPQSEVVKQQLLQGRRRAHSTAQCIASQSGWQHKQGSLDCQLHNHQVVHDDCEQDAKGVGKRDAGGRDLRTEQHSTACAGVASTHEQQPHWLNKGPGVGLVPLSNSGSKSMPTKLHTSTKRLKHRCARLLAAGILRLRPIGSLSPPVHSPSCGP